MADDTHSRFAMVAVVSHTTKHMTHSRSWDMEIGRPSVENVTLGLRLRVAFSTSGSSYFHVPLTTVHHCILLHGCAVGLLTFIKFVGEHVSELHTVYTYVSCTATLMQVSNNSQLVLTTIKLLP